jgi:apolipoprotein D and lipocalin family protein
VTVVNRGYRADSGEWKSVTGTARFAGSDRRGHLLVSFFPPFSASYVIIELDHQDYRYALVCGPNRDYLWILSREPVLDSTTRNQLVARAEGLGFPVDELLFIDHGE